MIIKLSAGPIPLYHQLEQSLIGRIAAGEFGSGGALPTEEQIGHSYGISRITVRRALEALHQQGLIVRRRGIGSFVAAPRDQFHSIHLTGSLDDFLQTANRLLPTIISLESVAAQVQVAQILEIEPGAKVLRLELVSSVADGPLAHSEFYFPDWLIGVLSADNIGKSEPIVRIVERLTGRKAVRAEQVIEPDAAGPKTAALLGIKVGTPLLRTQRVYFDSNGEPIEIALLRYHPGRYRYQVELRTRPYAV